MAAIKSVTWVKDAATIGFSPIERETPLSKFDAVENALGSVREGLWAELEGEGFVIEAVAEKL